MSDTAPIPVSVITGFLGAGKTTLLNRLVRRPEMARTAVIINEFGEIGLDHMLVERADETMIALSSGCLCCTIRGDLIETLSDLVKRRAAGEIEPFDRVVIETTGLADPAPILHSLMSAKELSDDYRLEAVITLVDALAGGATLDNHAEAVKQAAVADRLVLTKTDLATDEAALDDLRARLDALNPGAPIIESVMGEVDPGPLFDTGMYDADTKSVDVRRWLNDEAYLDDAHDHDHDHGHHHHHDVNRHDDHVEAYCVTFDTPFEGQALSRVFDVLALTFGQNLLRVKGIVQIAGHPDRPAVIHGVQHVFYPVRWLDAWPDEDRRSKIVFITRDIERATLEGLLKAAGIAAPAG